MSHYRRRILAGFVILSACLVFMTPQMGSSAQYGHITEMRLHAEPAQYRGPCPATINFNGFIRVDGPNTVIYAIDRSDGATGAGRQTLRFTGAGQKPVHFTWRLGRTGESYDGWAEIASGNSRSNRAVFHLRCR
jgi:hypothetical protein